METTKPTKKKWFALATLFTLLIGGVMVAYAANSYAASNGDGKTNCRQNWEWAENATKKEVKAEFMGNLIDELGLSEDATLAQIREAMETQRLDRETEMNETRAAIEQAIEDKDYDAWKELVNNTPQGEMLLEVITIDNFAQYAQMKEYQFKADEIAEELGLKQGPQRMDMGSRGRGPGGLGGMMRGPELGNQET